jgi:hypothetical protein
VNSKIFHKLGKPAAVSPIDLNVAHGYEVLKNPLCTTVFSISFLLKIMHEFQELFDPSMYTNEQI